MEGILPRQAIERLIADGSIDAAAGIEPGQLQPASLDLRLGPVAHRIRASFLPGRGERLAAKVESVRLHTIDLSQGAVLETGCVYLVPLQEQLALPADVAASTNPKSSTGRLDVFTRVIADGAGGFDFAPAGYRGALAVEISPRTFPILVRAGSRLSQIRFRRGDARLTDAALTEVHRETPIATPDARIHDGLNVSIDLMPEAGRPAGYRAKRHTALIDVDKRDGLDMAEFWDPIEAKDGRLILDPNEFYILMSREAVTIPPQYAAEMVPFDPLVGEFRAHYAGFFDPGFGTVPSRAVLEVRSREVPFILEHGQVVARLAYERMAELPDQLYGTDIKSNYQAQSLKLSKHFKAVP
ncbi:2'-deoxycytidine 5'-triphosphate deaminase [Acuticoccus sp. MNP-M23]|uniref:2'-deoxycytidine 5'-triphosphate deaminase n=1 Tax=Acuticoccus sp. MNP-M23 TaxID=3072793 RepID=UPI00281692B7|nr:2'-deoxycytidine 5'-triphosphate deaminase [Acuticoccus sp. MNP-M23]WMS44078.1 2'-deoxycytidine 5'-triphosphate deaminase [Acuticoccus sp. MNP-M23]